jgi:hypothetical protein
LEIDCGFGCDYLFAGGIRMTRAAPERAIQIAIKRRLALSGVVCHHSPNAARRSVITGVRLKQEGMITGWPDLTLVGPDKRIAFLEVKAEKGRTSAAQDECLAMLRRMGHDVAVVRSQDDAVLMLQEWGWNVR